jgi:hypothetical protein
MWGGSFPKTETRTRGETSGEVLAELFSTLPASVPTWCHALTFFLPLHLLSKHRIPGGDTTGKKVIKKDAK